jgi:hypothetical protein
MDDEHDDYREREERAAAEMRAESEDRAETEDREGPEPSLPEVPEEPEVYTPEEYQLAQQIKAYRLYKEEHSRIPYTASELSHFLMKANIERPLKPDDDDLQAARNKLEGGGS